MSNVHEQAEVLENALRESDEFKALKISFELVMNDAESKELFEQFRSTQMNLQQKQMQGEELSEEDVEQAREVVEKVQAHEDISKLMESEQRVSTLINEISEVFTRPIEQLYQTEEE
ncbi:MAG TPA: YlbF family regulator [Bacillota bacterium]|nr:YlbF family regulator [Bacillota bacterium]